MIEIGLKSSAPHGLWFLSHHQCKDPVYHPGITLASAMSKGITLVGQAEPTILGYSQLAGTDNCLICNR
jgi:hypothetical protein